MILYALFCLLGFCQLTAFGVWSVVEQNKNETDMQNANETEDNGLLRIVLTWSFFAHYYLVYLAVATSYGIYLYTEARKTLHDFERLETILIRRWIPWCAYSMAVSVSIVLSIDKAPLGHSGHVYILLLASMTVNYWIIANLPAAVLLGKKLPGTGLGSAAEVLDDLLDNTQLLLILVGQKRELIPCWIQRLIILFSCANFVSPTLLLGDLVPPRARLCLSHEPQLFCPEFYTVVDKIFVDVPRAVLRIVLIVFYKEAADEEVLEMFVYKTFLMLLVAIFPVVRDKLSSKFREWLSNELTDTTDSGVGGFVVEIGKAGNENGEAGNENTLLGNDGAVNGNGGTSDENDDDGAQRRPRVDARAQLDRETTMDVRRRQVNQTDTNE